MNAPSTPKPAMQFIPLEQAICLKCQSEIPRQNIVARMKTTPAVDPTKQNVRAYCEHCSTMFEVDRELRGGVWQLVGDVEIVDDAQRKTSFLKRIAAQRGEIQNEGPRKHATCAQ